MFARFFLVCSFLVLVCCIKRSCGRTEEIQNCDHKMAQQNSALADLEKTLSAKIQQQNVRFSEQDAQIAKQLQQIERRNVRFAEMSETIAQQNVKFAELQASIERQNKKFADQNTLISEQNTKLCEIKSHITEETKSTPKEIYSACKDVKDRVNGVYNAISNNGDNIKIFCDFRPNEIVTFISKHYLFRLTSADLTPFFNNHKKFILRQDWKTEQKDAQLQQLSKYSPLDLQFYVNDFGTFGGPRNTVFGDFAFVGFVPKHLIYDKSINGYAVSQTDYSFPNCGNSGFSYFTFFPNLGNVATIDKRNYSGSVNMFAWSEITKTVSYNQVLPEEFFYTTEVHFGGCGGFTVSSMWSSIRGTSLGLVTDL